MSVSKDWLGEEGAKKLLEWKKTLPDDQTAITIEAEILLGKIAMQAGIFAMNRDILIEAANSADAVETPELPPLPFPVVVVEADTDEVWSTMSASSPDQPMAHDENAPDVQAFALFEIEQGKVWEAWFYCVLQKHWLGREGDLHARHLAWRRIRITNGGKTFEANHEENGPQVSHEARGHWGESSLVYLAVEAVHLITARGVSLATIAEPRQSRRARERRGFALPPHLYWVTIDDTLINSKPGHGEKEFRYRWLVRGHWRHFAEDRKTWVRAYIKGKPGAPWKGRPVYRVLA